MSSPSPRPIGRNLARLTQPLAASIPITIFSVAALSLPLATTQSLELSTRQTRAWIFALYAAPGLASILLTLVYRQPLLVAWYIAVVAFVASLSRTFPYHEILGAMIVAGLVVAALGALGLTPWVATLVPTPVVFGVVAGNVLPFVVGTFEALNTEGLLVGAALAAYLGGRRAPLRPHAAHLAGTRRRSGPGPPTRARSGSCSSPWEQGVPRASRLSFPYRSCWRWRAWP